MDSAPQEPALDAATARQELEQIHRLLQYTAGSLSGTSALSEEEHTALKAAIAAVEGQVSLPPYLVALPITEKTYLSSRLAAVPVKMADLLRHFAFFYVQVPVMIWPRPGYNIEDLEVRLFYNLGQPPAQQPLTYDIFPARRWLDVIDWREQLELVLDEGAHFKVQTPEVEQGLLLLGAAIDTIAPGRGAHLADPKVIEALSQMGVDLGASIGAEVKAGASIKLGPFHYLFRRPLVSNAGVGNARALWRFDDRQELQGDDEIFLGVVLQVPRGLQQLKIVPHVLARPRAIALNTILASIVARLRAAVDSLRQQFGPQVEQQIDQFECNVRNGWTIRIGGGDIVWDLSSYLAAQ